MKPPKGTEGWYFALIEQLVVWGGHGMGEKEIQTLKACCQKHQFSVPCFNLDIPTHLSTQFLSISHHCHPYSI